MMNLSIDQRIKLKPDLPIGKEYIRHQNENALAH